MPINTLVVSRKEIRHFKVGPLRTTSKDKFWVYLLKSVRIVGSKSGKDEKLYLNFYLNLDGLTNLDRSAIQLAPKQNLSRMLASVALSQKLRFTP